MNNLTKAYKESEETLNCVHTATDTQVALGRVLHNIAFCNKPAHRATMSKDRIGPLYIEMAINISKNPELRQELAQMLRNMEN